HTGAHKHLGTNLAHERAVGEYASSEAVAGRPSLSVIGLALSRQEGGIARIEDRAFDEPQCGEFGPNDANGGDPHVAQKPRGESMKMKLVEKVERVDPQQWMRAANPAITFDDKTLNGDCEAPAVQAHDGNLSRRKGNFYSPAQSITAFGEAHADKPCAVIPASYPVIRKFHRWRYRAGLAWRIDEGDKRRIACGIGCVTKIGADGERLSGRRRNQT